MWLNYMCCARLKVKIVMLNKVFPNDVGCKQATSFLICSWSRELKGELLDINEGLFKQYEVKPTGAKGSCDDRAANGTYSSLRKRLLDFLQVESSFVDFRLVSEPEYQDDFFSSKVLAAFSLDKEALKQGVFSVREENKVISREIVVDIYLNHLKKFGLFYGGAFLFPAKYGPDYYLSSVNTMPKGTKFGSNDDYVRRLCNWRENSRVPAFNPLNGYFREIYQYNFIVEAHLNKSFRGGRLKEFMESNGSLIQIDKNIPQFLWGIETEILPKVRGVLETSGLVLSSSTKPLSVERIKGAGS